MPVQQTREGLSELEVISRSQEGKPMSRKIGVGYLYINVMGPPTEILCSSSHFVSNFVSTIQSVIGRKHTETESWRP